MDQVMQLAFVLLAKFAIWLRPFLPTICFVFVWGAILLATYNLFTGFRKGVENVRRLHRIPCAGCQYATNSHYIKCSLQPSVAFSEEAIDCSDFEPGVLQDLSDKAY
ncbi:hypothetical protein [cf. Phormidesmis sp. LEGE 11477]|uniref:hypothetical protein n=1 Tax=cf. Phormidesmis sp. LEGE 11477 TaxID=1828680 RepID=UPI0018809E19|nr:hypothetical protein [cf. Phormidesmis sp. LEGE 11477]MBE9064329.1 hypothetical protein [cf. Phormidesmis sp. LEGE 11477]